MRKRSSDQSMTILTLFLMAGAFVLSGALSSAFAGADGKLYSGWMCRATNGDTAQYLQYHYQGGIANTHTSSPFSVTCPIMRDSFYGGKSATGDQKGLNHARIDFIDNHPSGKITCTIAARQGSTMRLKEAASGQSPAGKTTSTFTIRGPKKIHSYVPANDYYIMRCSLPPKTSSGLSILQSYYVEEFDN